MNESARKNGRSTLRFKVYKVETDWFRKRVKDYWSTAMVPKVWAAVVTEIQLVFFRFLSRSRHS